MNDSMPLLMSSVSKGDRSSIAQDVVVGGGATAELYRDATDTKAEGSALDFLPAWRACGRQCIYIICRGIRPDQLL